jgi:hypothetical protein
MLDIGRLISILLVIRLCRDQFLFYGLAATDGIFDVNLSRAGVV